MDSLHDYGDPMDMTPDGVEPTPMLRAEGDLSVVPFRTKSLTFAAFPWTTPIPMVRSKLIDVLGEQSEGHFAFNLANSLDNYDKYLESQNIHNSPIKALLRDMNADSMAEMTVAAISRRETSILRSREKANEICSLFAAYRLMDVIGTLEPSSRNFTSPPSHRQMAIDLSTNEKALRVLENWTVTLKKFRHNFTNSTAKSRMDVPTSDLPAHQLQELFKLQSGANTNKTLVNLQLAATHIAYMIQRQPDDHLIPDFPGSFQALKDSCLRGLISSEGEDIDLFMAFLEALAGGKDKIDNLRIPLQVALLISPIFLLQDAQMHISTFYAQRYKIILYSKALGNDRPKIITEIERIVWDEIFDIAKGLQTVHDAASNIFERIPETYDHFGKDVCGWFNLGSVVNKEILVNLSSFSIKEGTLAEGSPCFSVLKNGDSFLQPHRSIEGGTNVENGESSVLEPRKRKRSTVDPPLKSSALYSRKVKSRPKSVGKASKVSSSSKSNKTDSVASSLPIVVGKIYRKVENFDLEELSSRKIGRDEYVPLPENASTSSKLSVNFHTFDVHGERREHTFQTSFENVMGRINKILEKIEGKFPFEDRMHCDDREETLAIKAIGNELVQRMSPQSFQQELRKKHIIIADNGQPSISCDRAGLMTLNSLKELVKIEDQSTSDPSQSRNGILRQFVENLELNNPNTLRIGRMRSDSGPEASPFSTEHVAWRETILNPYCEFDSLEKSPLRWTDVSTANAIQSWTIAPGGFGIFFDVRSGSQLVIIATGKHIDDDEGEGTVVQRNCQFQESVEQDEEIYSEYVFEAIRLEAGNRLILRPNTPHTIISLENTVSTGGFFLCAHTLFETLIGQINYFIVPTSVNGGESPPFSTFIRRILHYMHDAYVVNDSSDRSHLLSFSSVDDARDLFSLVTMAVFLNVFEERTYLMSSEAYQDDSVARGRCFETFDLNAIPVLDRHHFCYIRGIALDLLNWFLENYSFSSAELEEDDIDAFRTIFIPFIVRVGRQIVKFKRAAEEKGPGSISSYQQVNRQVQSALLPFDYARDVWLEEKAAEEEKAHENDMDGDEAGEMDSFDFSFDVADYIIRKRDIPDERRVFDSFLDSGRTFGDDKFFRGLKCQFDLKDAEDEELIYLSS